MRLQEFKINYFFQKVRTFLSLGHELSTRIKIIFGDIFFYVRTKILHFKLKISNQKLNYEFNLKPEPVLYKGASWNIQSFK